MNTKKVNILPQTQQYLEIVGKQIRLARKRRKIPIRLIAERTNISRQTVSKIEKGDPTVSFGAYAAVLHALDGLDKSLSLIAKEDKTGWFLQDMRL